MEPTTTVGEPSNPIVLPAGDERIRDQQNTPIDPPVCDLPQDILRQPVESLDEQ